METKKIQDGAFFLSFVVIRYEQREVQSMAFGNNIKKLREEKNLTQQQLADKLYVSRQTICRWENGSRCPDLITAKKLALELKVSMDELISDEAAQDIQINYGIWKLEKIKNRRKSQNEESMPLQRHKDKVSYTTSARSYPVEPAKEV